MRSYQFLDTFKTLLSERNHSLLYFNMTMIFPMLFQFQQVGVLLRDETRNDLYALHIEDPDNPRISEEHIIRFPMTMGLTGRALDKRHIIVSQIGEKDTQRYSAEIDNFMNCAHVKNIMIGPIFDAKGEVRGVLQFINKLGKPQIEEQDEIELNTILPALGEILKTADESLKVSTLAAGLSDTLALMTDNIEERVRIANNQNMPMIGSSVRYINELLGKMVQNRKETVFSDPHIRTEVFKGLRQRQLLLQ